MTTIDDVIEQLVRQTHGVSDWRTQHLYRQTLQVLVEMAKAEERHEQDSRLQIGNINTVRGTMH
jgi:hypothetical protein